MKGRRRACCAYCRREFRTADLTEDHVPPRGVYGKRFRAGKSLPWVWCCKSCREGQSDGDDALKVLVGMGVIRFSEFESVREETRRAIQRNPWWRKQLVEDHQAGRLNSKELWNGEGALIPMRGRIALEIQKSIVRICRGILFQFHPELDTRTYRFDVHQIREDRLEILPELLDYLFRVQTTKALRIDACAPAFSGLWWLAGEPVGGGILVQIYFGGLVFVVIFHDPAIMELDGDEEGTIEMLEGGRDQ